ncbi:MAG: hypothetical protein LC798_05420 [Chloroflexi bacterium]|nr:hypothetical protein [Chloroflexota bacterium]
MFSATEAFTAAFARRFSIFKGYSATQSFTAGISKFLTFQRAYSATQTFTPSMRIEMPEVALDRIAAGGTPDWPLNAPLKAITGVTRDTAGAIVGSCTVKLFRQSDDVQVGVVTSHATTGAYSFTRGGDDPNSYYVLAYKTGAPEIHGVTDRGLTPS